MRTTFTSLIAVAILITAGVAPAQQALFKVGVQRPLADDRGALVYSAEVILAERVLVPGERTTVLLPLPDEVVTVGLMPVASGALGLKDVEVFAQNDSHVARYHCLRSGALANVWMKDRWADTGREPDPATAGQPMWQSPYIWVRLAEDTNLEHEHEHENPVRGQTNHVYMKLHNDGAASQSGNVELYFTSASTNLNNPANWTQIGTQAKTLVEVSASQISPLALQFIDQERPALFEKEGRVIGGVSYILWVPAGQ